MNGQQDWNRYLPALGVGDVSAVLECLNYR
jgi:hypothetical protein